MQRTAAVLVGVAMLVAAAPATASDTNIREQNREFLLEHIEDYDPDKVVEVRVDGEIQEMTFSDAIDHALDMVEDRDLEQMANSAQEAKHDTRDWVGELLHLGIGGADCGTQTTITEAGSDVGADLDPQFELHEGPIVYTTGTNASRLHLVDSKTMKEGHLVDAISWTGKATSFCIPDFLVLDRIDGIATNEELPEEGHELGDL